MSRAALAIAGALLAGCAATGDPAQVGAIELRNPGFEAEPGAGRACPIQWDCSMHADPGSFRFATDDTTSAQGKRSARVERVRNEPWALVTQTVRDPRIRGAKLRLSVAVRLLGANGGGGGPFIVAHGPGGRILAHGVQLASGTQDWKPMTLEFIVPADTEQIVVGATLEGPGTLWLDEARLEWLGPAAQDKKPV